MSVNLFLRIVKITEKKIYTLFIIAIIPRFEKKGQKVQDHSFSSAIIVNHPLNWLLCANSSSKRPKKIKVTCDVTRRPT